MLFLPLSLLSVGWWKHQGICFHEINWTGLIDRKCSLNSTEKLLTGTNMNPCISWMLCISLFELSLPICHFLPVFIMTPACAAPNYSSSFGTTSSCLPILSPPPSLRLFLFLLTMLCYCVTWLSQSKRLRARAPYWTWHVKAAVFLLPFCT